MAKPPLEDEVIDAPRDPHSCLWRPRSPKWEEIEAGEPGPGQAKIKQYAAGVNYIDVYHRTGLYKQPSFPFTPGSEGAGQVVAVGPA